MKRKAPGHDPQGDLLAEIDSRPYEAALQQMEGQLARDRALLEGAKVDLARYQRLTATKVKPGLSRNVRPNVPLEIQNGTPTNAMSTTAEAIAAPRMRTMLLIF